jgi:hypothetical protein
MRAVKKFLPVVLVLMLVFGCATLKQNWDKATPKERAALVLYGLNKSLGVAVDSGIAYVKAHPDPKTVDTWQTRIIPAMDGANKVLRELMIKNESGQGLTVDEAMNTVVVQFNQIQAMLRAWGIDFKF